MKFPEGQAEAHGQHRMETEKGIEGDGQPKSEAHRDLFRHHVGVKDLGLELDPEGRSPEEGHERQRVESGHEDSKGLDVKSGTGT